MHTRRYSRDRMCLCDIRAFVTDRAIRCEGVGICGMAVEEQLQKTWLQPATKGAAIAFDGQQVNKVGMRHEGHANSSKAQRSGLSCRAAKAIWRLGGSILTNSLSNVKMYLIHVITYCASPPTPLCRPLLMAGQSRALSLSGFQSWPCPFSGYWWTNGNSRLAGS